ncbi:MAG TPA: hypothetical protein VGL77_03030 [Armatimonadota bacterium]|jgi:hypothetical protein
MRSRGSALIGLLLSVVIMLVLMWWLMSSFSSELAPTASGPEGDVLHKVMQHELPQNGR